VSNYGYVSNRICHFGCGGIISILYGELNKCPINYLKNFLKSDLYIVLGSSYIKGELVNFLIKKKAINIHAGVTPFYRGSDCNFWALFDNNPHLVGSTIHLLSKGLDDGSVLYHAMSKNKSSIFNYTMSTLLSAFKSIGKKIKDKSIFNIKPAVLDSSLEIRYTKKIQFNSQILKKLN
jgi:methionyl-tRNA formyltransferase